MGYKILENDGTIITNLDGAAFNFAAMGYQDGIIKNRFNELRLLADGNSIIIDTGEIIMSGVRVIIDEMETITLSSTPQTNIQEYLIAQISVNEGQVIFYFYTSQSNEVIKENIFNLAEANYAVKLASFIHTSNNEIIHLKRELDFIESKGINRNEANKLYISKDNFYKYHPIKFKAGFSIYCDDTITPPQLKLEINNCSTIEHEFVKYLGFFKTGGKAHINKYGCSIRSNKRVIKNRKYYLSSSKILINNIQIIYNLDISALLTLLGLQLEPAVNSQVYLYHHTNTNISEDYKQMDDLAEQSGSTKWDNNYHDEKRDTTYIIYRCNSGSAYRERIYNEFNNYSSEILRKLSKKRLIHEYDNFESDNSSAKVSFKAFIYSNPQYSDNGLIRKANIINCFSFCLRVENDYVRIKITNLMDNK